MQKKCEKCGKMFEAKQEYYKVCYECNIAKQSKNERGEKSLLSDLLLKSYFYEKGNLVKEIFLDIPDKIAKKLYQDHPSLKMKQLRDFYSIISNARTSALLKGIDSVRSILWQCATKLEYQLKREIIPQSFVDFMRHHLKLAEKDEKHLDAFYQHLDSIVCYFPK